MTEQEFLEGIDELIDDTAKGMKEQARRIPLSGCLDIEKIEPDTYGTLKNALVALLQDQEWRWGPIGCDKSVIRRCKKETKNILMHI